MKKIEKQEIQTAIEALKQSVSLYHFDTEVVQTKIDFCERSFYVAELLKRVNFLNEVSLHGLVHWNFNQECIYIALITELLLNPDKIIAYIKSVACGLITSTNYQNTSFDFVLSMYKEFVDQNKITEANTLMVEYNIIQAAISVISDKITELRLLTSVEIVNYQTDATLWFDGEIKLNDIAALCYIILKKISAMTSSSREIQKIITNTTSIKFRVPNYK